MSDKRDKLKRLFAQDKTPQTTPAEPVPDSKHSKASASESPASESPAAATEPETTQDETTQDDAPTRGRGIRGRNYGVKTGTHAQLKVILERETYEGLKRYLLEQQLAGNDVNGSEVIEDLLKAFLDKQH
jgi:hypothetical protein